MKERPILFSAPMVRAILDGRKTQTRRILKGSRKQPYLTPELLDQIPPPVIHDEWTQLLHPKGGPLTCVRTPFQPGMRLWVKEAISKPFHLDTEAKRFTGFYKEADLDRKVTWVSPIFMPRWASRITLEVTEVRVERLQDISAEDCRAEGVSIPRCDCEVCAMGSAICPADASEYIAGYRDLWESIHGPGSWDLNPWVFAVSFKRVEGQP